MTDMRLTMGGLEFRTPLLTGSGTFGYGDEFIGLVDYDALGGLVAKSVSLEPRPGNKPPRICEAGGGIINNIGLANPGIERFLAEKANSLPFDKTRVFLSVVGRTIEDFVAVIERMESIPQVSGYELNVSCPNVKRGGLELGSDKEAVHAIVKAARAATTRFLSIKLTPNQTAIAPLAEAAVAAGADALTLVNTLIGMAIDAERRRPLLGNVTGGYSGPPLKPVALAKVWQAAREVNVPIWASGGIVNGIDGIEFLLAGASGLQIGSALIAEPGAPRRILSEMEDYCQRHGVERLSELVGTLEV